MAKTKFGSAFSDARKAGLSEFEFGGKKYTTRTADDDAKDMRKKESFRKSENTARNDTEQGDQQALQPVSFGMDAPRRAPRPLHEGTNMPGTNVTYENADADGATFKRGGSVKKFAKGGLVRRGFGKARGA